MLNRRTTLLQLAGAATASTCEAAGTCHGLRTASRPSAPRLAGIPGPDQSVGTISAIALWRRIGARPAPLIVDARSLAEQRVSRIAGAVLLEFDAPGETALAELRHRASGRDVVLYCTTSVRSRQLGEFLLPSLMDAGAGDVMVIEGGLIAWANAGGALVDYRNRPTTAIHPANDQTIVLLKDPSRARYAPAP